MAVLTQNNPNPPWSNCSVLNNIDKRGKQLVVHINLVKSPCIAGKRVLNDS